jgi:hypothetical protein
MSTTATAAHSVMAPQARVATPAALLGLIRRFPVAAPVVLILDRVGCWLLEIPSVLDARGELPFTSVCGA